ncbi:SCO family protein [Mesorhizobium australicum]|uniref:Protein SCO1/2 n=1 Tax=Mesorhizobium australicum TaxID=536018 RepID=A0A1X7MNH3_9HYPH|nr:SCO family protein [Mesorhizobium australicum]SMH26154.1 protein SCO1/2 [Mesorhizobium australicum]
MRLFTIWIAILALMAAVAPVAQAHSLDEVDAMLGDKEKYFQVIDKPALDFKLRSSDGRAIQLADLRGKILILHFIYTSCPDVCPLHTERLAQIKAMVNDTPMKDRVRFVTITTDPSNDTPQVLSDYATGHGLDIANWLFLTTTPDQPEDTTRKLAEAFGHKFSKTDDGLQMHGIVTHVIDKDGRWKANFHGLNYDPVNLVTFVNALTNDVGHPHEHGMRSWWDWLWSG